MDARVSPARLDALLSAFQAEQDEALCVRLLDCLISEHAEPLICKIVRSVLPSFWGEEWMPAFEDIKSEIVLKLVDRLRQLKSNPAAGVEDLLKYVAVTSYNTCYSHLRSKKPRRWSLRNKLKYAVTRAEALDIWEAEGRHWLCGLRVWRTQRIPRCSPATLATLAEHPGVLESTASVYASDAQENPAALLAAIFDFTGSPVELDNLVDLLAGFWAITDEHHAINLDDSQECRLFETLMPNAPLHSDQVERRAALALVWAEVKELPPRQRAALLLGLRDDRGVDCITMFSNASVASLSDVAAALDMKPDDLAMIWDKLPMNDSSIALHQGVTRQQVVNLRKSARKRLKNRTGPGSKKNA
jgi:hypothetical protein